MQPLTVMTYNVYVGSSVKPLLNAENVLQIPTEVATIYHNVIASDFPGRAMSIAKAIKTHQPHLVGLQEISKICRQGPGNFIPDNSALAEKVELDYLQILMDALQAEGLDYKVAAQAENIDIEMPMVTDTEFDNIRLTNYNVILARSDVEISRSTNKNFTNTFIVEMFGLEIFRGYAAVDATISGITYRCVNTHLEAFVEDVRVAQTQELVDILRNETLPIILVGDFNTAATNGTAYQMILSAEYTDIWQMDSEETGNTCCQDGDILNEESNLTVRIDHIFTRNLDFTSSIITHTVGDKPSDRLPSGLWPSDHAGVVAQIAFE